MGTRQLLAHGQQVGRLTAPLSNPAISMKCILRCLWTAFVLFVGAVFVLVGISGTINSAILVRARAWPHVTAVVERCELSLQYGKSGATWEAHAVFRYGAGQTLQYETTWQPAGSPEYSRSAASNISREQFAAFTKKYCSAAANEDLRVSPMFPGIARRNEAVEGREWMREIGIGLFVLIGGLMLCAASISTLPWIEGRKMARVRRNVRRTRRRVGGA
ncbi:DUF3592 domain-containing protein [Burkholderia territorii]|uniref:DUF3592 domain-containing protein n=1 Tax=Burkholderia territorii TaxID=1503055 RepID=UPI000A8936FF|nr:DUF3592 domain-containing protein [Burkholderia territorii]